MKKVVLTAAIVSLTGCANMLYGEGDRDILTKRASFEFDCPTESLNLIQLKTGMGGRIESYGVKGCGKRGVYLLDLPTRQWILNSAED